MPLYVYGLMRASDLGSDADLTYDKAAIDVVVHEGLAALTSAVEGEPVRLRREAVTSHSDVLQRALKRGPIVPLRFGTIVPDADTLKRDLLAARHEEMRARLEQLAGKAEFRLKVTYREDQMLRSILVENPALKRSAQAIQGLPAQASHFHRVGLGERITLAVQARRDADARDMLSELAPLAVAVEVGALQQPEMTLNVSFLVSDEMREPFDQTVERLASERAQLMEFKLIGPLPAHSFADGQLGTPVMSAAGPMS